MTRIFSWTFIVGLALLVWYSPIHAIAIGAVLAGLCVSAIYLQLKEISQQTAAIALFAIRRLRDDDGREARLKAAMDRYGFSEKDLKEAS